MIYDALVLWTAITCWNIAAGQWYYVPTFAAVPLVMLYTHSRSKTPREGLWRSILAAAITTIVVVFLESLSH